MGGPRGGRGGAREGAGRDWRCRRAESAGSRGGGPGSGGPARGLLQSVKSAPPALCGGCVPGPGEMENGAVYRATTEEHPAPARGARSGLAAYFFLGRLKLPRRVLKVLQLVRAGAGAAAGAGGLDPGPSACRPGWSTLSSGSGRFHTRSSSPLRLLPPGGPSPPDLCPDLCRAPSPNATSGPPTPSVLGGPRKCVGGDLSETLRLTSFTPPSAAAFDSSPARNSVLAPKVPVFRLRRAPCLSCCFPGAN